jgi:hypothetical protein
VEVLEARLDDPSDQELGIVCFAAHSIFYSSSGK